VKQDTIATIYPNQKNCYFRALLSGTVVLDWSPAGVMASGQNYVTNLAFVSQAQSIINETYTLPSGKRSIYTNSCNELRLTFKTASNQQILFYFRAYDEAVAYSYQLLGTGNVQITGEVSGFALPKGSTGWGHSPTDDEQTYDQFSVGAQVNTLGFPVLFKTPSNAWVLITEAAVYGDYTGTSVKSSAASNNIFQLYFPSVQGPVSGTLPWKLPWRVAIVGATLGPLVASSVVENLNPPCALADVSWIKSGRCMWSWLSENVGDTTLQKKYIDFAGSSGWEYNLIDDGFNKTFIPRMCQYGTQHSVANELWYNYTSVKTQAQQATVFAQCKAWGIKSLKIDFIFDNISGVNCTYHQNIMQWIDMTANNLAANQLMATFHGCTFPRGQRRRWPHLMTWEAVKGYEYIGRGYPGPKHNCMLPFTRNVIGPMDMTPVLFTLGKLTNGMGSTRTSTDAHELALSVVMESGIQHFADKPESYNACIGKSFLQAVPSAWDEIRFIDGYPGQSAIFARRKGNDWYIGGISALAAKTMTVSLAFLKPGSYTVDLYKDSIGTTLTMAKQTITLNPSNALSVWVNTNGGFCFKVPASYVATATVPGTDKFSAGKSAKVDRLGLYHTMIGKSQLNLMPYARAYDLRGRVVPVSGSPRHQAQELIVVPVLQK
jgi:alpha-glucosidase